MADNELEGLHTVIQPNIIYQVSGRLPLNASSARAVKDQLRPNVQIVGAASADIRGSQIATGDKSEMPVFLNDVSFAPFEFIPSYICLDAADGVTAILTGVTVFGEVDSLAASSSIGITATADLTIDS